MRLDQIDSSVLVVLSEVDNLPSDAIIARRVVAIFHLEILLDEQCCRCLDLSVSHPIYPLS